MPKAYELAEFLRGTLADTAGTVGPFNGIATLGDAEASEISFVANENLLNDARASLAGLLVVPAGRIERELKGHPRIEVDEVWGAVAKLMQHMYPEPSGERGIHETSVIGRNVNLGRNVTIGPYTVLGDGATIGNDTVIGPHCSIDGRSIIGNHCILHSGVVFQGIVHTGNNCIFHSGAVLGADGFKFELVGEKSLKIPQVGRVVLGDDVEIGANTTIDRAFLHETRIDRGTKIDNLVQIAHNVTIGPSCFIAAQVGIAGSTCIGPGCMIGGQAGFSDGLEIGPRMRIGGNTTIHRSFPEGGETIWGFPATPLKQYGRIQATLKRLPELDKRILKLEKQKGES